MTTKTQEMVDQFWDKVEDEVIPLSMSDDSAKAAYARCIASGIPRKIDQWLANEDGTSALDVTDAFSAVYCGMMHEICVSAGLDKHGTAANRRRAISIGANVSNTLFRLLENGKPE